LTHQVGAGPLERKYHTFLGGRSSAGASDGTIIYVKGFDTSGGAWAGFGDKGVLGLSCRQQQRWVLMAHVLWCMWAAASVIKAVSSGFVTKVQAVDGACAACLHCACYRSSCFIFCLPTNTSLNHAALPCCCLDLSCSACRG
jgi:hypothetical protein